jgi:ribosomal protein L24E
MFLFHTHVQGGQLNMPTCSFCKKSYKDPRGLTVFTFDGIAVHFCSSKCRRNVSLGRDAKKLNWTKKSGLLNRVVSEESNNDSVKIEKTEEKK